MAGIQQQRFFRACRNVAEEAARAGGRVLLAHRYEPLEISHKEPQQEVVTNVDRLSDTAICAILRRAFPHHTLVSEESETRQTASPYTWIVDPLDGTESYIRGLHYSAVTIALTHAGQMCLGVVYHPFHDEIYTALGDEPTTVNGHPVHVTDVDDLRQARLIMDYSPRDALRQQFNALEWERGIKQMFRFGGSIALNMCQVAKGAVDGYVYGRTRNRVKSWDIAAAALLVRGAGGRVLNQQGHTLDTLQPQGFVLCDNTRLDLHSLCTAQLVPPTP
jgi:myo-inositol-1(or 4)-monophosphatase